MEKSLIKKEKRERRHRRIRSKVFGTAERPRLSVFKSNTALSAQLIDDENGKTIVSFSTKKASGKSSFEKAENTGKELAKLALEKKIKKVVFDRGGYIYTGRIKALAEGARAGGLQF